jgi:CubicO group peptidase (beta-lactamase class C family)
MRSLICLLWALTLASASLAAGAASPSSSRPAEPYDSADIASFIDGVIAEQQKAYPLAGVTVSVVGDGRLLFARGYGFADVAKRTRVDPDRTLFRVGSVSKLVTWTAVMQLAEQGRVDLDADVNRYLDFKLPTTFKQPVTLRTLLGHTAGFEDRGVGIFQSDAKNLQPLGQYLRRNIPARVRAPGTAPAYSNYGAALAGYIVERVSGMSFDTYAEKNIFAPLGMHHSSFREPLATDLQRNLATGYAYSDGRMTPVGFEYIHNIGPAGSMSATSTDMARFMLAHLSAGKGILRPATTQLMHSRLAVNHPAIPAMAYGFFELRTGKLRAVGHGGNTDHFHSYLVLVPERGLGLFVSYTGSESAVRASRELVSLFLERFAPVPGTRTALKVPAEPAEDYIGSYRTNRHSYTTIEKFGVFGADVTIEANADGTLSTDAFGTAQLWAPVSRDLYRWVGGDSPVGELGSLAFVRNAEGKVSGFGFGASPYTRMEKLSALETSSASLLVVAISIALFVAVLLLSMWELWTRRDNTRSGPYFRTLLAGGAAALYLVFFGFIMRMMGTLTESGTEMPPSLAYILSLPLVAILLTCATLALLVRQWKRGGRSRWLHLLFIITAIPFIAVLDQWNLLGFNY